MSLLVDEVILGIAGVCLLIQIGRHRPLLDSINVALMSGFMGMGILAYVFLPVLSVTVQILPFYGPHAYNLILWPSAALVVLRNRFSPRQFLAVFAFVYGLDELFWNSLAVVKYWGQWDILKYFLSPGFLSFFSILCVVVVVTYLYARPKLSIGRKNPMPLMLGVFGFFWAWIAGFPILAASNILSLSLPTTAYLLVWELLWQTAYWVFVWATIKPRVGVSSQNT